MRRRKKQTAAAFVVPHAARYVCGIVVEEIRGQAILCTPYNTAPGCDGMEAQLTTSTESCRTCGHGMHHHNKRSSASASTGGHHLSTRRHARLTACGTEAERYLGRYVAPAAAAA